LGEERLPRVVSGAVGLCAFAGYVWSCAPGPYLLDSPELAQAAFGLGIAHPPGEPLAALWGKVFTLLPFGSVAFRVGLGQAAAGAVAAVLLFWMVLSLLPRLDPAGALGPRTRVLLAAAAALGFAYAPGAVIVADRPEVYALQTALSLGALLAALCAKDPRALLLAALLLGLGLANHPLVAGLAGVGATLAALPHLRAEGRGRLVALSVGALAVGALVVAYLPARAAALATGGDTVAWGDARTLRGLWWVLSARTFAEKAAIVHTAASPFDLPFVLAEELEPAFAVLAPAGVFFLLRRARLSGAVVLVGGLGAAAAAVIAGLDPGNPDVRGYLGPAIAVTAVLSGCAVAACLIPMGRWVRPALAAALCIGALTRFPLGGYPGLRHAHAGDVLAGRLLAELPPRAALLTADFEGAFLVGYQRVVEGRRPDVSWAHLGFVAGPGYSERLGRGDPGLAPLLASVRAGLTPDVLEAVDERHPVRLEPDEHLPPAVRERLVPAGLTWRLGHSSEAQPLEPPPAASLAEAAADPQTRGFLAWRAYNDAAVACERRLRPAARAALQQLATLLPADGRARALAARCREVAQ
jgi:hypothetical protein